VPTGRKTKNPKAKGTVGKGVAGKEASPLCV